MYNPSSRSRKRFSWIAVSATLIAGLLPGPALAAEYWVSCSSCSSQQASVTASEAPSPPGTYGLHSDIVYVVDPMNKSARKYEITTIHDPLFYSRAAQEFPMESSVSSALSAFWSQAENLAKIDVPEDRSPSAVDYLANPFYTGRTRAWIDEGSEGFIAGLNAARLVANVTLSQALATLGADRGPLILTLEFADGSKVKVKLTLGQDAMTSAPTLADVTIIENSAFDQNDNPLPTQASGFSGYDVS